MSKLSAVALPDKPLEQYTPEEYRIFQSPSVESHLDTIRQALALTTMLHMARAQAADLSRPSGLEEDAERAVAELSEQAWTCAKALTDGFPSAIHNLHVVRLIGQE